MAARPCKFGFACKRADCWFAHPEGRQIDGAKAGPPQHQQQHPQQPQYAIRAGAQNFKAPEGYGAAQPQYYQAPPQYQQQPLHGMAPHNPAAGGGAGGAGGAYRSVTRPLTPHGSANGGTSANAAAGSAAAAASADGTAMLSDGKRPCKFGRECHRKDCYFSHPEGRDIDDSPHSSSASTPKFRKPKARDSASPSDYDIEDDEDDLDDNAVNALVTAKEWFPAYKDCSCCKGYIHDCEDTTCQALGTCGCAYGKDDGADGAGAGAAPAVDEAWKDEWFAASRTCKCCEGYVYRCKATESGCAGGKCFCHGAPSTATAAAPAAAVKPVAVSAAAAAAPAPKAAAGAPSAPGGPKA